MANKIGEVGVYYIKKTNKDVFKVKSSSLVFDFLHTAYDKKTVNYVESFKVLALNNSNEVVDFCTISTGGITGCLVDVRNVMQFLLVKNAVAFIVSHNHPSGKLQPSLADRNITEKLKKAGETLDIKLLDHLIYTPEGYFSFADDGSL